jgi:hypothetical protein
MLDFKEKRSYLCSAEFRQNSASNTCERQGRTDSKEFASFRLQRFRRIPQRLEGFGLTSGKVTGSNPVSAAVVKLGTSHCTASFEECSSLTPKNPRQNVACRLRDGEGSALCNAFYAPALRSVTVSERINLTGRAAYRLRVRNLALYRHSIKSGFAVAGSAPVREIKRVFRVRAPQLFRWLDILSGHLVCVVSRKSYRLLKNENEHNAGKLSQIPELEGLEASLSGLSVSSRGTVLPLRSVRRVTRSSFALQGRSRVDTRSRNDERRGPALRAASQRGSCWKI